MGSAEQEPSALRPAEAAEVAWVARELQPAGAEVQDAAEQRQAVAVAPAVWAAQPRVVAAGARPSEAPQAAELSAVVWVFRRDQVLPWALLAPPPAALLAHAMANERIAAL